ncbi:endopeptidase La [Crenobacter sp. SG2303]|uniref:Lon protease n=1 Tax=Crenobacter oryzisoli TaxID=3056844 RepID=A0ABT7XNN4_9NEIS|nr:endopeptidase La [Crenobacter sp. SG2303]MDN0075405.1 endopeptidase La [Crenobacter sp. SG2303]
MSREPTQQSNKAEEDSQHAQSASTPVTLQADMAEKPFPEDALIIIPMHNAVLFPGIMSPVTVGRASSVAAAQTAVKSERQLGFLLQRDPEKADVGPSDLYWVGTAGPVIRYITGKEGEHHLVVQGTSRFQVLAFLDGWPFLVAKVAMIEQPHVETPEIEARFLQLKERAIEAIGLSPNMPDELADAVQAMDSPAQLADMVANLVDAKTEEKQEILETFDLMRRLDKVITLLAKRIEVLKISKEIGEKTRAEFDEREREHVLREQLRQIQKELGEDEELRAEIDDLYNAIEAAGLPEEVFKHAQREIKRLQRMGENSAEYSMLRTYLEWLTELPWKQEPQPSIDIKEARQILDEEHFGLEKIKLRILEFLAVRKLNPEGKSPILCFVGPPGVGKTSLGQSIARATGRVFQRVSLGGVHDEAEIRGHRRTYIGALPGNIIQAMRKAGTRNALIMLDEIDKLGTGGYQGDPASALLEVLDPEQNNKFRDNYLAVDFDLSRVLFICTANVLETIPGPLRDRMEIIHLPGYTEEEKIEIARRYLVKRQLCANGLTEEQAHLTNDALVAIVRDYTREAGVRSLEREIGSALRRVAMNIAEGRAQRMTIDTPDLSAILGPQRFENEMALRVSVPGVATGLAWTPVGGDILFIEASKVPGNGRLILTGQLGEVMKESAQAALTLAKIWTGYSLEKSDIHVHVPAGATPKDGPSAGVAMFLAILSLLTGNPVRADVAMTGEVSLRGLVLPIGGVKEKTLAALRAGIQIVMLPRRNEKDLEDVPPEARDRLTFVLLDRVEDAVHYAIGDLHPIQVSEE